MAWEPDYVSADEMASYVRVEDLYDEAEIAIAITAASRTVDHHCNRQFGKVEAAEERLYTARPDYGGGWWVVDIDDLQDTADMVVEVNGEAVATYDLGSANAAARGLPYTRLHFTSASEHQPRGARNEVAITARWGWNEVPTQVKQATLFQASRFITRRNAPFGVAGSPDQGSEMRLLSRVDPDVAVVLRGLMKVRSCA